MHAIRSARRLLFLLLVVPLGCDRPSTPASGKAPLPNNPPAPVNVQPNIPAPGNLPLPNQPPAPGNVPLPNQQPDGALPTELGDIVEVNGYILRPPKGYPQSSPAGAPAGTRMVAWGGSVRPDGTAPMFQLVLVSPPPGQRPPGVDQFLTSMLDGVRRRRQNWSQSPPEWGTINGLAFLRIRWSGTEPSKGWKMHGVMYAAFDGRAFIQLHTQDIEPHHEQALKIGEAATLTFRKK